MIDVTTTFAVISWKKEVYRNMIADKIKNARTIKKLTQEQVAEDLNVSRQTISNWEAERIFVLENGKPYSREYMKNL